MAGSAKKIYDAAAGAPEGHSVVLLAHNGPTGQDLIEQISEVVHETNEKKCLES